MPRKTLSLALTVFTLALMFVASASATSNNWTEKVLHRFQGGGGDGVTPYSGLIFDQAGNLYGATYGGGQGVCTLNGCGTVIQLSPKKGGGWATRVLYRFLGGDGSNPLARLIFDQSGNLYGATQRGGDLSCNAGAGCGTVFELSPPAKQGGTWTETVLHNFTSGSDGWAPDATLAFDQSGNLFGTTAAGGGTGCSKYGCGTVFELAPPGQHGGAWTETVLYAFSDNDGAQPMGDLVLEASGALYGTTYHGGSGSCGVVFRLNPPNQQGGAWTESLLHHFTGKVNDGCNPYSGVILDEKGNLYGTAEGAGQYGHGIVFQLKRPKTTSGIWKITLLHSMGGGLYDGSQPEGDLIFDNAGNLYGTTSNNYVEGGGGGMVFQLEPPSTHGGVWKENILHGFDGPHGWSPWSNVTRDKAGNLYGTTVGGGYPGCDGGCGVVFEMVP